MSLRPYRYFAGTVEGPVGTVEGPVGTAGILLANIPRHTDTCAIRFVAHQRSIGAKGGVFDYLQDRPHTRIRGVSAAHTHVRVARW